MRIAANLVAIAAVVLGAAMFFVGFTQKNDAVVQSSAAVTVAGLALLGASAGLATWKEERRKAREQQQRDTYSSLVLHMLDRFARSRPYDPAAEAVVRSKVVTWAEASVVNQLAAWNKTYDQHIATDVNGGATVSVTPVARADFERATAELVQAVRKDLAPKDQAAVDDILHALFNRPSKPGS